MKALLLSVLLLTTAGLADAAKPGGLPKASLAELAKQLESIVLDKVEYREATIVEIADDLVARSKQGNKAGFTISLRPAARKAQQETL